MRNFERAVIINSLCLAAAAAASVVACSTTNPETPTEDGGLDEASVDNDGSPPVLPDGAVPDSSVVEPPKGCTVGTDCPSGVCNLVTKTCAAATCKDGVKNAVETDIDCGGDCPKCDNMKTCKVGADCTTGVCKDVGTGLKCQPPSSTDGVKNGIETDVDCGGIGNPTCVDTKACKVRGDCTSGFCKLLVCSPVTPDDGFVNGTETDVDCGGPDAKRCADNLACIMDSDCVSDVCTGLVCQPPSYTDGKKNGTETDTDCGGDPTLTYGCATGLNCMIGDDCKSLGCDYNKKCAAARSCTTHYGGDTCGLGGEGGVGAEAWESCCKTEPVTTASGGLVYMDKYPATAGRMRVFMTSINYDVRGFVQAVRAAGQIPVIPITASTSANPPLDGVNPVLDPSWDKYLPTSFSGNQNAGELSEGSQNCTGANGGPPCAEGPAQPGIYTAVRNHLGGNIFRSNSQTSTGCYVGSPGTHSFRFPNGQQDGAAPAQSEEVYDTKTLNCVDYLVAQAFCVWDGGRLETFQEWQTAWGAGTTPYSDQTAQRPAEPNQRTLNGAVCTTSADCPQPPAGQPATYTCTGGACALAGGDRTYWGCRFPWATDALHPSCSLSWPATTTIDYANYKYTYEYPKLLGGGDYIVHLSAPGRLLGRGPLGHADLIGTGFELTSSVTWRESVDGMRDSGVFQARHRWAGNGSWEVHGYSRTYTGNTMLLNKYGKLGLRCVKFAPN